MFDYGIADEVVDRIVELLSPQRVILFGSVADGTATEDSDIDVLVVTDAGGDTEAVARELHMALADIHVDKDIIVVEPDDYEARLRAGAVLICEIDRNGFHVYEADMFRRRLSRGIVSGSPRSGRGKGLIYPAGAFRENAVDDYQTLLACISMGCVPANSTFFHAQQYAEKMIKDKLSEYGIPVHKEHSLAILLDDLTQGAGLAVPRAIAEAATELDRGYEVIRYPGDSGFVTKLSPEEAERACDLSFMIVGWLDTVGPRWRVWHPDGGVSMFDYGLVDDAVDRIVGLFSPQRVILFGSVADGVPNWDSDLDLLVVMDIAGDRRTAEIAVRRALADIPVDKDVLVLSPGDFELLRGREGSLVRSIAENGFCVYEAGMFRRRLSKAVPNHSRKGGRATVYKVGEFGRKAQGDLAIMDMVMRCGGEPADQLCYHSEQYAEKMLKEKMTGFGLALTKEHSLAVLLARFSAATGTEIPGEVSFAADRLDSLYRTARYPDEDGGGIVEITVDDAELAYQDALSIVGWLEGIATPDVRGDQRTHQGWMIPQQLQ